MVASTRDQAALAATSAVVATGAAAAGEVRSNSALQEAAEKLAANPASQDDVARLGELQQAAARDESE